MMTRNQLGGALTILAMTVCVAACKDEGLGAGSGPCAYGGATHQPGASFPSTDGCNTCQCASNGQVACTLMACLGDASFPRDDAAPAREAGADAAPPPDALGAQADVTSGILDGVPARDAGPDGAPLADARPDGGPSPDLAPDGKPLPDAADAGRDLLLACAWMDASVPVGGSVSDGCNTCACSSAGVMMCTARACPPTDAQVTVDVAPDCGLPAALTFGRNGGLVMYEDAYALDSATGLTITRTYYRTAGDGADVRACSPPLPSCGAAGVVSVATIVSDLAAADVQSAFAPGATPLFGVDQRPMDGTVYAITVANTGTILVGAPCPATSAGGCIPIPAGVQRLATDLQSLASAAASTSACANL